MHAKFLPYMALILVIVLLALLMPSSTGFSSEAPRLTPTPFASPTPTPTPAPTVAITPIPAPQEYVLRSEKDQNTSYDDVKLIQARLKQLGYYSGEADGFYGRSTFLAVYNFQRMNGLDTDGMAGETTQRALFEKQDVLNSLGQVYVPFTAPTPSPTPTPAPTKYVIPMDSFEKGADPVESWFGGDRYSDGTISVQLEQRENAVIISVSVANASQLRGALAGTFDMPQSMDIETLSRLNNAVVAIAAPDYRLSDDYSVRQYLSLKSKLNYDKTLMIIDSSGDLRLYGAQSAQQALERLKSDIYQAVTVDKALIISSILQPELSDKTEAQITAIGQTDALKYVIVSGTLSQSEIAQLMLEAGCKNAAIIGASGVYTCFGDLSAFTYADNDIVSNIIYFASNYGR